MNETTGEWRIVEIIDTFGKFHYRIQEGRRIVCDYMTKADADAILREHKIAQQSLVQTRTEHNEDLRRRTRKAEDKLAELSRAVEGLHIASVVFREECTPDDYPQNKRDYFELWFPDATSFWTAWDALTDALDNFKKVKP